MQITTTPEPKLVYTNRVYVSAACAESPYIEVGRTEGQTRIYQTEVHSSIEQGKVGLSSLQRETCELSVDEAAPIWRPAPPLGTLPILVALSLNVRLMGIKTVVLEEREVVETLKRALIHHVLSKDQALTIEHRGTALILRCESLQVAHKDPTEALSVKTGTRGRLMAETQITLTPSEDVVNRRLTIKFDPSTRAKTVLVNPHMNVSDLGIGGLDHEFDTLLRRAFVSRGTNPELVRKLGMRHVKGILLYGPAGTGKTLIARKIGALLNGANKVEPKIVNGPELLNKFVGESEKNLRLLFEDARRDQQEKGEASPLHVIIFDEIDALMKARGREGASGATGDTIVNQMLAQMDGVDALNNILVIGMTNRKELLDPALLRPGRLEVHLEIGLPDDVGRKQIFDIHMSTMRENRLVHSNVDVNILVARTKNYSGAEIEGVIKSAANAALYEHVSIHEKQLNVSNLQEHDIHVEMSHFIQALNDVRPAFGVDEDRLSQYTAQSMIDFGPRHIDVLVRCKRLLQQTLKEKHAACLLTILLKGEAGSGKTTLAAHLAAQTAFPFVRFLSPDQFVGMSEAAKINEIRRTFDDAYRSPASLIVLDSIERLVEFIGIGPRFSHAVLQTLLVLLHRAPPNGRRLVVVGTTSRAAQLDDLELIAAFQAQQTMPLLCDAKEIAAVQAHEQFELSTELLTSTLQLPIAIKSLLSVLRVARTQTSTDTNSTEAFLAATKLCGM